MNSVTLLLGNYYAGVKKPVYNLCLIAAAQPETVPDQDRRIVMSKG